MSGSISSPASTSASASQSSQEERRYILSQLPVDAKSLAIASARVYHAPLSGRQDSWTNSGLKGMLVFGRIRVIRSDSGHRSRSGYHYWLWLVDVAQGKGIIWKHQIADNFQYHLDKPFFHFFPGNTRLFGFLFDDDADAGRFCRKVEDQLHISAIPPRKIRKSASPLPGSPSPVKASSPRLRASMISGPTPGSFVHVSHVGYNEKGRIEASENLDAEWGRMLEELQGHSIALEGLQEHGVSRAMLANDTGFVQGFLKGVEASARNENPAPVVKARKSPRRKPVVL